jgi:WhiB family transcriptional regulator, redox-sensing transcriptional regulator
MDRVISSADAAAIGGSVRKSQGWRQLARCLGQDPELWYPDRSAGVDAVAICCECPVRIDCLNWAIEHHERDGIWGGVSARRRARMRAEARFLGHTVALDVQSL